MGSHKSLFKNEGAFLWLSIFKKHYDKFVQLRIIRRFNQNKPINPIMKKLHLLLTLVALSNLAFPQKLPAKQENSIYAPANVKLDGKITEWENLQAYNPATEIAYTMANDKDNLYFVCSATVVEVIQKIIGGGITLSISSVDKKSVIEPVAITYPIVPWVNAQVNYLLKPSGPLSESNLKIANDKISGHLKKIEISGIKEFSDGSISVYNDKGVKGAHYIGSNKVYTYELVFPLSFIRALINEQSTFNYKVQINDGLERNNVIVVSGVGGNDSPSSNQPTPSGATNFNATYTLIKK